MKKIISISLALLLSISALAIAAGEGKARYLVKSNDESLKSGKDVRHDFDNGFTADLTNTEANELRSRGIEVEAVPLRHITAKPGSSSCNPAEEFPWGVRMVNGGSGGDGAVVAVLDTGVKKDHPDLAANILQCKDATGTGIANGCTDRNGHGTHVAGTIAANGKIKGVAPNAKLIVVKVCGNSGCWADDVSRAIMYAADNGANIISMSLGGDSDSTLERDAIAYAVSRGVLVVAAAGNDGPADGSIDYPGANVDVVAVAALDSSRNVPDWSSRGLNNGDYVVEEQEVELAAPGVSVQSTYKNGCYATMSGTSMATPHVSGLAAKNWQGSASATRDYLHSLAQDVYNAGDDTATGWGLPVSA